MKTIPFRLIHVAIAMMAVLACSSLAGGGEIQDAAKRGDLEKVKALLKENPALAVSKDDTGWTPLHLAAQRGFKDVVELLLANKADVDAQDSDGGTPLHMAARSGCKEVVQILLANKAKVDVKDNDGITPLKRAMLQDQQDVVELLRQHGRRRINLLEKGYAA